jgi:hypothetical protein
MKRARDAFLLDPMRCSRSGRWCASKATKRSLPQRPAPSRRLADTPHVRVYGPEPKAFLGGGHIAGGELISTRLLSPIEAGAVQLHSVGLAR